MKKLEPMLHFTSIVDDYEHSGDLDHGVSYIKSICPKATNFKTWEERDYEAEGDYEEEYGECDEPIYQGYISFDAPKECLVDLQNKGYYPNNN